MDNRIILGGLLPPSFEIFASMSKRTVFFVSDGTGITAETFGNSILNQFAIKPVQQFAYTTGKNATDSTMIIDAMDLLYTRRFDGVEAAVIVMKLNSEFGHRRKFHMKDQTPSYREKSSRASGS